MREIIGHNNYAYHALLAGNLTEAHAHVDTALNLADTSAIEMPRQYLYSTRGEIALQEGRWDEADAWFERGLAEVRKTGNRVQSANYRANIGLAAQGRGQLDDALLHLESAWQEADGLPAPYLQVRIDLWLTDLHWQRGERTAATQCLQRARDRMRARGYRRFEALAAELQQRLLPG